MIHFVIVIYAILSIFKELVVKVFMWQYSVYILNLKFECLIEITFNISTVLCRFKCITEKTQTQTRSRKNFNIHF